MKKVMTATSSNLVDYLSTDIQVEYPQLQKHKYKGNHMQKYHSQIADTKVKLKIPKSRQENKKHGNNDM